jgi:hypothetical protein
MAAVPFPKIQGWPTNASVLAGTFAGPILHALMDPVMLVHTGWYVDSLGKGPVWHRWLHRLDKGAQTPRIGIAMVAALYGLATRDIVVFDRAAARMPISLKPGASTSEAQDGLLEESIARVVRDRDQILVRDLVEGLVPAKLSRQQQEDWLRDRGISWHGRNADPAALVAGIHLAGLFVRLEVGLDVLEQEHESVESLLSEIEMAVHERLSTSR